MAEAKPRILIIEDDPDIAALEKDYLEIHNYEVVIEPDGRQGAERAVKESFALILLDVMLPGKDGMALCREIRAKTDIPILMVTARVEDSDKILGLGLGADDYITKPFSIAELVARVKSHIARYARLTKAQGVAGDELDFGNIRINLASRKVFVDETEVLLTRKEFELLCFLASNRDIVFSKEQIYDRIWGEDLHGDISTVTVHIKRLREKIEKNPGDPAHIQTVWGTGYKFTAKAAR
ncbi:MAG: response regulator transcription factor [Spirochaetes bacterium]|nr:response regulator transcription factor [Spirochaetota bacterium]